MDAPITAIIFCFSGFVSGYIFAIIAYEIIKKITKGRLIRARGYHFHHSLFIVPAILLAILFSGNIALFFLSGGIGALSHDVLKHKGALKFITKD